jgi:hypothetical protein
MEQPAERRQTRTGQGLHDANTAFGRTTRPSSNRAEARFTTASSDSSSAIRRFAARSSALSTVEVPAISPRSMPSCRTQRYTVASATSTVGGHLGHPQPDRTWSTTIARNCGAYECRMPSL